MFQALKAIQSQLQLLNSAPVEQSSQRQYENKCVAVFQ